MRRFWYKGELYLMDDSQFDDFIGQEMGTDIQNIFHVLIQESDDVQRRIEMEVEDYKKELAVTRMAIYNARTHVEKLYANCNYLDRGHIIEIRRLLKEVSW